MIGATLLSTLLLAAASALPQGSSSLDRFETNLAYRSPSLNIRAPLLEHNTQELTRRHAKRNNDGHPYYKYNISFPYGVASGDPYEDSVILWTMPRKVSDQNAYPPICLLWVVAPTNSTFKIEDSVQHGYVETTEDVRYSTKVEATGLKPYTKYYYRFESCAGPQYGVSRVGSFTTLPSPDTTPDQIKLAVFSCSNYPAGYFQAYGYAAAQPDLFAIQHIGDYIYEYKTGDYGTIRKDEPNRELSSLEDYRDRHATYKTDPDLQAAHAAVAWQTVWDDHEVADNTWKGGSADSNNTIQGQIGDFQFSERKAHAVKAYYEWMPIRQVETDDKLRIWRSFKIGKLADMIMLDTRQYDRDLTDVYYNTAEVAKLADDKNRSMTGDKQNKWFLEQLSESQDRGATWKLVMQQVVFGPINYGAANGPSFPVNLDAHDGYRYERSQILKYIADNKLNNTVILSGDSHASWVNELAVSNTSGYDYKTGEGSIAVEFAGTAVSSPSSYGHGPSWNATRYQETAAKLTNGSPGLQFAEGWLRGGFFVTVTPQQTTATYFGFEDTETHNMDVKLFGNFTTLKDSQKLSRPLTLNGYGALKQ